MVHVATGLSLDTAHTGYQHGPVRIVVPRQPYQPSRNQTLPLQRRDIHPPARLRHPLALLEAQAGCHKSGTPAYSSNLSIKSSSSCFASQFAKASVVSSSAARRPSISASTSTRASRKSSTSAQSTAPFCTSCMIALNILSNFALAISFLQGISGCEPKKYLCSPSVIR